MNRTGNPASKLCMAILAAMMLSIHASATIINVPGDQPTIQAGINAAVNGDTVLVAPGTYNEAVSFSGKSIAVVGSGGKNSTTLSASGLGLPALEFTNIGARDPVVIEGLTIANGIGGIVCQGHLVVRNCRVTQNFGRASGGGVWIINHSLTMVNCEILTNSVSASGTMNASASGGGIFVFNGSLTLVGCDVKGNHGSASSVSATSSGGGIHVNKTIGVMINCDVADNSLSVTGSFGATYGGGIACYPGFGPTSLLLVNCLVRDNQATAAGRAPGVYNSGSTTTFRNCTIVDNEVVGTPEAGTAGVVGGTNSEIDIANSVLFGNPVSQVTGPPSTTVQHCCIEGGFAGAGNISSDPLFVNVASGDFHLQDASPCRDAGNSTLLPPDTHDLDDDNNSLETLSRDLDLARRVVNGQVDMGAYEWQRTCLTDISRSSPGMAGDGFTNIGDLLAVIAGWGPCDQCNADVNNDDVVNITDLLAVIAGWGACQ